VQGRARRQYQESTLREGQNEKIDHSIAAALAMAPAGAGAGPVMKQAETEYALSELANVAIANARCDLQTPDAYFDQLLALNRQGWTAKRALILRSLEHTSRESGI
jgi:hypothetical protein